MCWSDHIFTELDLEFVKRISHGAVAGWSGVTAYILLSQSAVLAAILNISIPLEVGRLVNTVSGLSPGEEVRDYLQRLMPSGVRLAGMYLTQVSLWGINQVCFFVQYAKIR